MSRPRLLDLFCCAGGAAKGYHDAGFDMVGVDVLPQPRYPYEFYQADALWYLEKIAHAPAIDAIHASPPCQDHSSTKDFGGDHGTGWMLLATREKLKAIGLPWVLENVQGSPLPHQSGLFGEHGLTLCGCMFPETRGLLYEDRLFETSFPIAQPSHRRHIWPQTKMGRPPKPGECMQVTGHFSDVAEAQRRMGLPGLTQGELAQAIPRVYTRFIGERLLAHLRAKPRAA
jgi:DNA (cytosine-5)-methyltransferase 1